MDDNDPTALFWTIAAGFLERDGVTRGTMMGFPCLRLRGDFFASCDHRTGALVIKLAASRVNELVESGDGLPFAPNGRRFREWVMFDDRDEEAWTGYVDEALACAEERAA